ncbi:unnamed protein product [Mycetohabitans rhizoxinica HKI 454]|uniref:Uncharacterized protein n=1 Tax=Mycetohabitans rhizoxinica (strain DSM 19002 / CIP 109453 / HKI 454) TaxID=882378 RepID=E5ARF2_MYCRK|nr:unnamed protein product [Mycetohabitans rhizoxinica HKI 454]
MGRLAFGELFILSGCRVMRATAAAAAAPVTAPRSAWSSLASVSTLIY